MTDSSELCWLSATQLAAQIAAGETTAVEALEAAISRFEKHNSAVNAVIVTQLDQARQQAVAADKALQAAGSSGNSRLGSLHGVPMTIKEAYNWAGTPTTWGNPAWANNVVNSNAVAVQRLIDAGAIIYGKTNVPLFLSDWQSFNEIYGTTNNPWDAERTPGGSSGGSAAALATGMTALEIGSDIGGSVRNPAHYCGVFGHKPTYGVVPTAGHEMPDWQTPSDIAVCGPMARSADDLELALGLIAGPAGFDATGYRLELVGEPRAELKQFKVAVMLDTPVIANDLAMLDALQTAVDRLAEAGADLTVAVPEVDQFEYFDNYLFMLRSATSTFVDDEAFEFASQDRKRYDAEEPYNRTVDQMKLRVSYATAMSHREWLHHHERRFELQQVWAQFFEEYDLLLCPTAASSAFAHDHVGLRVERTIDINGKQEPCTDQLFWAGWTCNTYLPSTVAPVGLDRHGLPVGIQIVAPHLADRRSIRYAKLVEQALGGFVPPPGFAD